MFTKALNRSEKRNEIAHIFFFLLLFVSCLALPETAAAAYTGEYWNVGVGASPVFPGGAANLTRTDNSIDFEWGNGSPDATINADGFVARWTETLYLSAGTYNFSVTSDDGARVYVDSDPAIINAWVDQGSTTNTATTNIDSGTHTIKVEYYENAGGAEIQFSYVNQAPTVSGRAPSDGGTGVRLDDTLYMVFNKNVTASAVGNIVIYDSEDNVFESIVPTDATKVSVDGNAVTIDPENNFAALEDYYVLIGEGAFYNLVQANAYAGISDKTGWNFTAQEVVAPDTSDDYGAKDGAWQKASQTITLTPSDPEPSSGVVWTWYCTDDGTEPCEPFGSTTLTEPYQVAIGAEGVTYLRYRSLDNVDNLQTTVSREVKIDKTAPTVNAGADETSGAALSRTASAADAVSGIDTSSYAWRKVSGPGNVIFGDADALSTTIDADAPGIYVIGFSAEDNAGNSSSDSFTFTKLGGAGVLAQIYADPAEPIFGFMVRINGGDTATTDRNVKLAFNAGADVKKIAISRTDDFDNVSLEDYQEAQSWDLCAGADTCVAGEYTVYVRFYTKWGRFSRTVSDSIELVTPAAAAPVIIPAANEIHTSAYVFTRRLRRGMNGEDVRQLQMFLNRLGFKLAASGPGAAGEETTYFGTSTLQAVIEFQKKYDLKPFPGNIGPLTLKLLNSLQGR